MGHHFVPQAYLKAFQDPYNTGRIWTLPRGALAPRLLPVKEVAQARGFYDQETEEELARLVESPANPVLDKLRNGQQIGMEERLAVAVYIATMLKRVPHRRAKAEALIPQAIDSTVASVRTQIMTLGKSTGLPTELIARRLAEVDAVQMKFERDPPESVKAEIRNPRPSEALVATVLGMTWRVLVAKGPHFFLTTDNPAFFHEAYGIGTPKSELRFPLSPTHAIHGSWESSREGLVSFVLAPRNFVMEFNRSLASEASRLVFYHKKVLWLVTLLERKKPYLSRIVWNTGQGQ